MSRLARLLFPAIRWNGERGYVCEGVSLEDALALGVGGFCIFGGTADAVRALTAELRARGRTPLLIASDLERGAGQQFDGATQLPPLAALGRLGDEAAIRRAAALTAREALALGVDWVFAPVADVDLEPENPIIGTRSFGSDPARVGAQVAAWIEACRAEGALACAKHFPGHGRTHQDSHAELPTVTHGRTDLDRDLEPFQAAIAAGVDSIMTAHVAYPGLDPAGVPATLSHRIVHDLLRDELGFEGLVVTDALIMEGVRGEGGEAAAAVRAVAAGCDALLYPRDVAGVLTALESAEGAALGSDVTGAAIRRIEAATAHGAAAPARAGDGAREWARETAQRTLVHVRGDMSLPRRVAFLEVDDDVGGPYAPPPRDAFAAALREAGIDIVEDRDAVPLVALYADIRAWKGRPGLTANGGAALDRILAERPDTRVVLFGHPRLAAAIGARHVLAAWGGEAVMQRAAAAWLAERSRA